MTKQDFLDLLRQALNGRVEAGQLAENMRFYEDYINTEIRKGKSEEEVLASLGDPRLIARTITETNGGQGRQSADSGGGWYGTGENQGYNEYGGYGEYGQPEEIPRRMHLKLTPWVWLILVVLVVVLVISAIFSVLAAILPVLLPILLALLLVRAVRDWLN